MSWLLDMLGYLNWLNKLTCFPIKILHVHDNSDKKKTHSKVILLSHKFYSCYIVLILNQESQIYSVLAVTKEHLVCSVSALKVAGHSG